MSEISEVKKTKEPKESKELAETKEKKVASSDKKSGMKKLDPETAKLLQKLNEKANKKSYGRKVRDSEIIALGLSLIDTKHIEQLQEKTLSEKDRLNIAHEDYQKTTGKITLDQFIGKLLKGEFAVKTQAESVKG